MTTFEDWEVVAAGVVMRQTYDRIVNDYYSDAPDDWEGHAATQPFVLGIAMGRAATALGGETEDEFMVGLMAMLKEKPHERATGTRA